MLSKPQKLDRVQESGLHYIAALEIALPYQLHDLA